MRGQGVLRVALAFAALLASLSLVVWRQSRALEELRSLDTARTARALAESERAAVQAEIQRLGSRTRIVEAGAAFGLRVPQASDIVILPLAEPAPVGRGGSLALASESP